MSAWGQWGMSWNIGHRWCRSAKWLVTSVGLALVLLAEAQAAMILSVDFDPVAAGIQDSYSVQVGQAFTANLVLEYNDVIGLDSYRFSVQFDNPGMSYSSSTSMPIAAFTPTSGPVDLVAVNMIGPFEAASDVLFMGPSSIAPTIVGSVAFNAGPNSGSFSINPLEDPLLDGSFKNDATQILDLTFNAGTITVSATPEPSSLIMCLTLGTGALARFHRRWLAPQSRDS